MVSRRLPARFWVDILFWIGAKSKPFSNTRISVSVKKHLKSLFKSVLVIKIYKEIKVNGRSSAQYLIEVFRFKLETLND